MKNSFSRLTALSMMTALVVVLQTASTFILFSTGSSRCLSGRCHCARLAAVRRSLDMADKTSHVRFACAAQRCIGSEYDGLSAQRYGFGKRHHGRGNADSVRGRTGNDRNRCCNRRTCRTCDPPTVSAGLFLTIRCCCRGWPSCISGAGQSADKARCRSRVIFTVLCPILF